MHLVGVGIIGSQFIADIHAECFRCEHEGIIFRECSFVQTAILSDDRARELLEEARAAKP